MIETIDHSKIFNNTCIKGLIVNRESIHDELIEENDEKGFLVDCGGIYINLPYFKEIRIGDFIEACGRLDIVLITKINESDFTT